MCLLSHHQLDATSKINLDEMLQYYLVLSKYPDYFYHAATWFKYVIAAKIL